MNEWNDLFVATAGSAAALAGLLFVGVSINLSKILIPNSTLPERALTALILLITILILSICFLIPHQSYLALGTENLLPGASVWIFITIKDYYTAQKTLPKYKQFYYFSIFLNQLSIIPYIVSAILLLNANEAGVYFLIFGFISSYFKSISDAWVLLVEINR